MSVELTENIVGLVTSVVQPLIDNVDALRVEATNEEDGTILVNITVDADDAGKVIGRQGRIIKSIRTLARALASREELNCEVELVD